MSPEYIPNIVTILRLFLVGPLVFTMSMKEYKVALFLFIIAGLTDAVDGYLARRFHWISRFGAMVDPLADKLLMMSSFFVLAYLDQIPIWLLAIVLIRDAVIVTGGVCYHFLIGQYEFKPRLLSRVNTFLQIILIVCILFNNSYYLLKEYWIVGLTYLVFFTSLISMLEYVWIWGGRALRHKR